MKPLRIVFMGTPDFAAEILQNLLESAHEVVCVYSQPPRPKGRGQKLQSSPVQVLAEKHGIPVCTPRTLKDVSVQKDFFAHKPDVAVVAAYGLILPKAVLEAPVYGCLNVHASLLPRWRGAAPIQRAIWEGDETSGVTIMQMDEGLDTGSMILKSAVDIEPDMTSSMLHDALAKTGGELITLALDRLAAQGRLENTAQDDDLATYAHMLKKEDGRICWRDDAKDIERQTRALNPWPGVWSEIGDTRFKVVETVLTGERTAALPGMVLDRAGHVACGGRSVLQILTIQPAGAKAMDFSSAVNGGYIAVDQVFQSAGIQIRKRF